MTRAWQQAASFAARAHRGQVRKDGQTPYVAHCFRVAMIIRDIFGFDDQATLCAALLHDTIEDTTVDYDEIAEHFRTDIADLVAAMTKNMALPELMREPAYDQQLADADWRARLIKLADAYDNQCETDDARRARTAEKARRALALAQPDLDRHPPMQAAAQALTALLEQTCA